MRRNLFAFLLVNAAAFLLSACPPAAEAKVTRLTLGMATAHARAADTLVTSGQWVNPPDDGKGALDSLVVEIPDLNGAGPPNNATLRKRVPVNATTVEFRQPIPARDQTYAIEMQVCRWRQGKSACAQDSRAFVYALAAPAPVSGIAISNVVKP